MLPERDLGVVKQQERILQLDHNQESIARKYDGGHRIFKGPSGSGKTLVLVHKADFLLRYNPAIKKILFVCFNITLVNYIKRLLAGKRVPLGQSGVEVCHFYELCAKVIGEKIQYDESDPEYYELVVSQALEKVVECGLQFDAILVDEGQDLSDDMYKVIISLLNPKTNSLTIAMDEGQNIYNRNLSWKELGIQARGRTHNLTSVYRNTKQIAALAAGLLESSVTAVDKVKESQLPLFPEVFEYNGPDPLIKKFSSYEEITKFIGNTIVELQDEGCSLADIAVCYTRKSPPGIEDEEKHIPDLCMEALDSMGILNQWISEDVRAKRGYDITTNRVTISTIHSIKGLDYSALFLLGLDMLEPGDRWGEEQILNLVYVAITRARYRLYIPYVKKNWIIERLTQMA